MTSRSSWARRAAHAVFRWLRPGVRRALVRRLTPNYTVGAVVIVRDREGALLLLRQPPGRGWSLPGGLLDAGESPVHGAARELAEETGIVVPSDALTPANPNARVNATTQQVDVVFTLGLPAARPAIDIDPVEVLEARWCSLDALPPLTPPTERLLGEYGIGPLRRGSVSAAADESNATVESTVPGELPVPAEPSVPGESPMRGESSVTGTPGGSSAENGPSNDPEGAP